MEISLTGLGLEGGSLLFVPVSAGICRRNRLAWMSASRVNLCSFPEPRF